MKLEDQVCTMEQAKRLKELRVSQNTIYSWVCITPDPTGEEWYYEPIDLNHPMAKHCELLSSAFTVAELGVMLPDSLTICSYRMHVHSYKQEYNNANSLWTVTMGRPEDKEVPDFDSHSEAEARAGLLIYLLENNLITAEEVNKRL